MFKTQPYLSKAENNNQKWLDIAKSYLEYGFSIIPVNNQKKPLLKWKDYQTNRADINQVEQWCSQDNLAGFAVVTGEISNLVVLDIDLGADSANLSLPKTPIVQTGSGGYHYYFQYPKDQIIKNHTAFRSKMDIRGTGGYAILPPTIHPNGKTYQWIRDLNKPLALMPQWLITELKQQASISFLPKKLLNGVSQSQRNNSAAKVVGKFLKHFPKSEWLSVAWPALKGWNLQNKPPLAESELRNVFESIANRELGQQANENINQNILGFEIKLNTPKKIILKKDGVEYRLQSIKGYKADVSVFQNNQLLNRDNLLLTSAKTRASFIKQCHKADSQTKKTVSQHLLELTQVLEKLSQNQAKKESENKVKKLSQEDKQAAIKILQSPTLFYDILQFIKKLGVIGEEITALTHYIVFTSRITDEPISEIVKGESSVGKSYVVGRVMIIFPKDSYRDITDATAQSFFYAPKDYFAHKIIVIFERHGTEKTDYSIRSLQSEKKLKLQVTVKDPETGQFITKEKEVDGPVGFVSTTTEAQIHNENETRILSVYPDENQEQTANILQSVDSKYRGVARPSQEEITNWQNIQRVLKPYPVFIPFVEEIRAKFPKELVRVRRDYSKFLSLLSVITLLHQKQRDKTTIGNKEYLVSTLADFHIAKTLFEDILKKTIYELPPKTEYLIKQANKLVSGAIDSFSISDLAQKAGWEYDITWKWFKPAYYKGFFLKTEEHKGSKAAKYKLSNKQIKKVKILPETEELYEKNKGWLGESKIYHPLTGQILEFQQTNCIDVLTLTEDV